jgi:succinyl-diaminopimelate desuccinylase
MKRESNIVKLTRRLVKFRSTNDNFKELKRIVDFCEKKLSVNGSVVRRYESNGYESLVATYTQSKRPKIFLVGHLDVVAGKDEDFTAVRKGGKLYGRGAGDMKSAAAVLIKIFRYFSRQKEKPSLGLMFATDEEMGGGNGPKHLLSKEGFFCDMAIVPDSNSGLERVVVHQKGALHLVVSETGKKAHGSRPAAGINAIEKLMKTYKSARRIIPYAKTIKWGTTMSLNKFEGGETVNQVPDYAEMHLDIRYPYESIFRPVYKKLRNILGGKMHVSHHAKPFIVSKRDKWIRRYSRSAEKYIKKDVFYAKEFGASDASHFLDKGISVVVTGIDKGNIHSDDEWVDINEINLFYKILKDFIKNHGYN